MDSIGLSLRVFVLWAMIPLTLVSGTPIAECVCTDGQHKLFCNRRNGCAVSVGASRPGCCKNKAVGGNDVSRVREPLAGTSPSHDTVESRRCCQAVLDVLNPSVVAEKTVLPKRAPGPVLCLAAVDSPSLRCSLSGTADNDSQGELPVPDLVVAHHAFLI